MPQLEKVDACVEYPWAKIWMLRKCLGNVPKLWEVQSD